MKKIIIYVILLAFVSIFAGCKSTELTNVWRDKSVTKQYKNLAVVALIKETNIRYILEDQMVQVFEQNGVNITQANVIVQEKEDINPAVIKQALADHGIDGVLIIKPMGVEKNVQVDAPYAPGFYAPYMWGGYFYGGYVDVTTSTTFKIENDLYDVATKKLVWSGQTNTFDPADAQTMGQGIANAVVSSLKSNGLIIVSGTNKK